MSDAAQKANSALPYELFSDGPRRWVLTEYYDEESAPVFRTIQDAYEYIADEGQPFTLVVHGVPTP